MAEMKAEGWRNLSGNPVTWQVKCTFHIIKLHTNVTEVFGKTVPREVSSVLHNIYFFNIMARSINRF